MELHNKMWDKMSMQIRAGIYSRIQQRSDIEKAKTAKCIKLNNLTSNW